jgi:hypothetical protein
MVSTVIIVLTFIGVVYGHTCNDFRLSASDQSVIDMVDVFTIYVRDVLRYDLLFFFTPIICFLSFFGSSVFLKCYLHLLMFNMFSMSDDVHVV